jgi:hypothetical protein
VQVRPIDLRDLDAEVARILAVYNQLLRPLRGRVTPWGLLRVLYRRGHIDSARVVMTGVVKPYRGLGIVAPRRGIHWDFSWVLEDNLPVMGLMQRLGAVPYKRDRLYEKSLLDTETAP